jgi:hypothetical protein
LDPQCGCHTDIGAAVRDHYEVVTAQARRLRIETTASGYDDAISDGQLALWRALSDFNPDLGKLGPHLAFRVYRAIIDGIRHRTGVHQVRRVVIPVGDIRVLEQMLPPWASPEDEVLALVALDEYQEGDARVPGMLRMALEDATREEIGAAYGITGRHVRRLIKAASAA